MSNEWKPLKRIEGLEGLNGLDVGSPRSKEYMKLVHGVTGSPDSKVGKEIERLGLKPGIAYHLIRYQYLLLILNQSMLMSMD